MFFGGQLGHASTAPTPSASASPTCSVRAERERAVLNGLSSLAMDARDRRRTTKYCTIIAGDTRNLSARPVLRSSKHHSVVEVIALQPTIAAIDAAMRQWQGNDDG